MKFMKMKKLRDHIEKSGQAVDRDMIWGVIRYVIVGFSTFCLDYFLNWLFISVVGINYLIVGYIAAPFVLVFNFVSHKFWSFRDVGSATGKTQVQIFRYIVLIVLNSIMNMILMYTFYGWLELPLIWARVVCTGIGIIWTFPILRLWVYKPSERFL